MWRAEAPVEEIAEALEVPEATIYSEVNRMRREGWHLPKYRERTAVRIRRDAVVEMWNQGASFLEITEAFGIQETTARYDVAIRRQERPRQESEKALGGETKNDRRIADRRDHIVRLRNQGATVGQICEATRASEKTVERDLKYLRATGRVAARSPGRPKGELREDATERRTEVEQLWNSGATAKDITEKLEASPRAIRKDLQILQGSGRISGYGDS